MRSFISLFYPAATLSTVLIKVIKVSDLLSMAGYSSLYFILLVLFTVYVVTEEMQSLRMLPAYFF